MKPSPVALRIWTLVAAVLLAGAVVLAVLGQWRAALVVLGPALVVLGGTVAFRGKEMGATSRQVREQKGPSMERRRLLMRLGALGAGLAGALIVVPGALQTGRAASRLGDTGWRGGVPLVDSEGRRIVAADITPGSLFTVYPEDRQGDSLAQGLLVGVEPARVRLPEERSSWAPDGLLAYSKLCTHMACPVGLYQPDAGTVECPCHQAVFDLLVGGEALSGPTRRPLPQLPLVVHEDGFLVAAGDFSEFVGTGFWSAP